MLSNKKVFLEFFMWCTVVLVSMWCRCVWILSTTTNSVLLLVQQQELLPFLTLLPKILNLKIPWVTICNSPPVSDLSYHNMVRKITHSLSLWPFHKAKYLSHASYPGGIPLEKIRGKIAWTDFTINNSQMRTCYLTRVWWLDCPCPAHLVNNQITQVFWPFIQYCWWHTWCILKTCKNTLTILIKCIFLNKLDSSHCLSTVTTLLKKDL